MKKLSSEEFIRKANKRHSSKYDYSNITYIKQSKEVEILCPVHGAFNQSPKNHLAGNGCPKCSSSNKLTLSEVLIKFKITHGSKYNYDLLPNEYISTSKKVTINCPKHGAFKQTPVAHYRGQGCPICSGKSKLTLDSFKKKVNSIHDNKYTYDIQEYINNTQYININCPIHGIFNQKIAKHLQGQGCPKCADKRTGWTYGEWEKLGNKSKRFNGFKVYIVKLWNKNEVFYKIGKTYLNTDKRFINLLVNYDYEILHEIKGNAKEISILEKKLHRINKRLAYIPKIKFKGMYECFTSFILPKKLISDLINNT
jgi:Zn finger protein HypA/HybF involved in hydrogenase expression